MCVERQYQCQTVPRLVVTAGNIHPASIIMSVSVLEHVLHGYIAQLKLTVLSYLFHTRGS